MTCKPEPSGITKLICNGEPTTFEKFRKDISNLLSEDYIFNAKIENNCVEFGYGPRQIYHEFLIPKPEQNPKFP